MKARTITAVVGLWVALGARSQAQHPVAGFEDYRAPVGRVANGVLSVRLDARAVTWRPWGDSAVEVSANAFAADGAEPRVPGPLIRVTAGTPVHVTVRNGLGKPLVVRGLHDRGHPPGQGANQPAFRRDSLFVPADGTAEVRFTPSVPGTYFYFGRAIDPDELAPGFVFGAERGDGPFAGVLIVDPPGTAAPPREEIFLITNWMDRALRSSWDPEIKAMINGRSWPHTPRLAYTVGDTVHWRVINASGAYHPMHLHGFFFRVDARGDQSRETLFEPDARRLAVTEQLLPGETMRVTWTPTEPGNWIFHCHLMRHMSRLQHAPAAGEERSGGHAHGDTGRGVGPGDGMAGMVIGITVRPRPGAAPASSTPRKTLRLYTAARPNVFGDEPAYSFVLQGGDAPPARDSLLIPGSPIVLTRGEPSEIVVHNRLTFPLGVHWHGLELKSWFDGVPDWSGAPGRVRPAIAPGDSFVVRMTPPRAGTFMYHVHSEPGHELSQGLYGPFLVLEPGERWDVETDRVFMLASLGAELDSEPAVNGSASHGPIELRAGTRYRLRFAHISADDVKFVSLRSGGGPVAWTVVAKDGANLPGAQAQERTAPIEIGVGEIYDVEWTPPAAGEYTLRVATRFPAPPPAFRAGPARQPHVANIRVHVR